MNFVTFIKSQVLLCYDSIAEFNVKDLAYSYLPEKRSSMYVVIFAVEKFQT